MNLSGGVAESELQEIKPQLETIPLAQNFSLASDYGMP